MTRDEAIKVLLDEWKCIDRNDGINCDRKCESCDLVMDSFVLKDAYNTAIKALEHEQALGEAFNIALLYGKEKGMEAIDKALYQMGMDRIKEQEIKASDRTCHTCKHYLSGERDGSCGSYICKGYSNWESEEV